MMTTSDVCEHLGISRQTWHRWRRSGIAPAALLMGPNTIRFRESDVAKFEAWCIARAEARERGDDHDAIPKPDYSLPACNDAYALAREWRAAESDSRSTVGGPADRISELERSLELLIGKAAIIASQSKPGELPDEQLEVLRAGLTDRVRSELGESLPAEHAERLEAILAGAH